MSEFISSLVVCAVSAFKVLEIHKVFVRFSHFVQTVFMYKLQRHYIFSLLSSYRIRVFTNIVA